MDRDILKRKPTTVFKAEFGVGNIPFLLFWMLNSISLRFFSRPPKAALFFQFCLILAKSSICQILTKALCLWVFCGVNYKVFSGVFDALEKSKNGLFLVYILIWVIFRPKMVKKRLFDQNLRFLNCWLNIGFLPNQQAVKGRFQVQYKMCFLCIFNLNLEPLFWLKLAHWRELSDPKIV